MLDRFVFVPQPILGGGGGEDRSNFGCMAHPRLMCHYFRSSLLMLSLEHGVDLSFWGLLQETFNGVKTLIIASILPG